MYVEGDADLEDHPERLRWLRAAADGGYPPAQFDMGCMYVDGEEVEPDGAKAEKWLLRAVDEGLIR